MIKIGTLCRRRLWSDEPIQNLCQVVSIYDHRDIDPECPESVAIIGMVKDQILITDGKSSMAKKELVNENIF